MDLKPSLIWAGALAFIASLGCITLLLLKGVDTVLLVTFIGSLTAAGLSLNNAIQGKKISKNVNGHLSRLADAAGLPPSTNPTDTGGTP